jgi:general secretion pathway protein D
MKLFIFALLLPALAFAADSSVGPFNFKGAPLAQVVSLYYDQVSKQSYALCDELLLDNRPVSFRASAEALHTAVPTLLQTMGYEAKDTQGVVTVCKRIAGDVLGSQQDRQHFVYQVNYRDANYLAELLQPMFRGSFANRRSPVPTPALSSLNTAKDGLSTLPPLSQSSSSQKVDDVLLFTGPKDEIAKLEKLLPSLDVPAGEVMLKAYFYEVAKEKTDGSALKMVASLLSGRLSVSVGSDALSNSVRLKTGDIDLVASALSTDSRFRLMSSPSARVRNAQTARFVVGQERPVLSAIVTSQTGQLTQSYERRDSGVIFEVTPRIRSKRADVDMFQQLSSFVDQSASVGVPPVLNKREMRTSLSVEDDELIVIGGLNEVRTESNDSGLSFMPWRFSSSSTDRQSELILILELKRL